ncbi:MAG: RNA methyltransferase [Bacteroidota bacterium]
MQTRRTEKFRRVAKKRQGNLTVVLENVYDLHNLGAVLRTADSVGVHEIYILQTDEVLQKKNLKLGKRTSSGARRWVDVHYYTTAKACFEAVKGKYEKVYSTMLGEHTKSLYELDLTESVALLFGNERTGLTPETATFSDGNFLIPQVGMVESLNISVACAVTLYEAFRQRSAKGFYTANAPLSNTKQEQLFESYLERHASNDKRYETPVLDAKKAGQLNNKLVE